MLNASVKPTPGQRHTLHEIVSEENLPFVRHMLATTTVALPDGREVSFEVAWWLAKMEQGLRGVRHADRYVTKLLYGWTDRDEGDADKLATVLGCTVEEAQRAVRTLRDQDTLTPEQHATGALTLLRWYLDNNAASEEIKHGLRELAARCARRVTESPDL